jgi:sec-independent protein translocase protein TatA
MTPPAGRPRRCARRPRSQPSAAVREPGLFDISPIQLAIVLVIALLVFGPKRLPDLARSVGRGIREFRGSISAEPSSPPSGHDRPPVSPATGERAAAAPAAERQPPDIVATDAPPPPARRPDAS